MKTNKLLAAGALALSMAMTPVASMLTAMPVMADTLTISNPKADVTYTAYQIFSGTVTTIDGNKVLADIQWGNGITGAGQKALAKLVCNNENASAQDVADGLKNVGTDSTTAKKFAETAAKNTVIDAGTEGEVSGSDVTFSLNSGYYVVVDNATTADKASAVILTIVGDTTVQIKTTDVPTSEKKVVENNSGNSITGTPTITPGGDSETGWNDVADYDIGETIPFEISAKLPDNLSHYNDYEITFVDDMSDGLTLNKGSIKVYAGTTEVDATNYTITNDATDEDDFEVKVTVKKDGNSVIADGSVVTVRFTGTLNSAANIGKDTGNPNTMHLEYPIKPGSDQAGNTGSTEEDKVIVFTYGLNITKTDDKNAALAGAEFYLKDGDKYFSGAKNADGSYTFTKWVDSETSAMKISAKEANGNAFEIKGIDEGTYTLVECTVPEGYKTPGDITVVIAAETNNNQSWTTGKASDAISGITTQVGTATAQDGTSITVINTPGGTLPETGGMGTTIIYSAGALLAAGAAVVYVTNKRTRKN